MANSRCIVWPLAMVIALAAAQAAADEPASEAVTLENVSAPEPNRADEPLAEQFSLDAAARFLDSAALDWQKSRKCFTCHTNYAYLMARPAITAEVEAHAQVRAYAEELINQRWQSSGPRWDAEVVATATSLALNDAATSGKLHSLTRQALDRTWTVQREDGGFNWLKCDWPPMESDDHYGATLAAIGVSAAPDGYAQTEAARAGLRKLRNYFRDNPPPTLHHRAMLVWASSYGEEFISAGERQAVVDELAALQHADGGWGLATLGDWKRGDGSPQNLDASDGYGTGFVIYVLRRSGVPSSDPRIVQGLAWLKANQRVSGRWFTRSLHADSKHFISNAGTAFAVMALAACE